MAKLKIAVGFTDKVNGQNYQVGDVIEFDGIRADELLSDPRGLVETVEAVEDVGETKPKKARGKKVTPQ